MRRVQLADDYTVSRIIKGCWQMAEGHGRPVRELEAISDLCILAESGITTFDCADIYTGVEELLGRFRHEYARRNGWEEPRQIRFHTKFVPDRDQLSRINEQYVERIINRSLKRLRKNTLDLVQFHWWDFDVPGYVKTAKLLATGLKRDLRTPLSGLGFCLTSRDVPRVGEVGVTNFDVQHLGEVLAAGVSIASNQVQYSLLDRRPEHGMVQFAKKHHIKLLCYGVLAGGFISERYLGVAEPKLLANRSLVKYKLIIDDFGGWDIFQKLLRVLEVIAMRHNVTIPDVAVRFVLNKPGVAKVILGGSAQKLSAMCRVIDFQLDRRDMQDISSILSQSNELPGDIYSLERVKGGKHAAIMRYNLNE